LSADLGAPVIRSNTFGTADTIMAPLSTGHGERDKNRELAKEHGKTLISSLRKTYGTSFALGMPDNQKLIDVIHQLDERSLSKLVRDKH
jgi:hypothetical protein